MAAAGNNATGRAASSVRKPQQGTGRANHPPMTGQLWRRNPDRTGRTTTSSFRDGERVAAVDPPCLEGREGA